MPKSQLTAASVARIKAPTKGQVDYFDTLLTGFALRVTDKGRKSWCAVYRFDGKLRRLTLGSYPAMSLAEARADARQALLAVQRGDDPKVLRDERKAEAREAMVNTFGTVAEKFIEQHAKRHNRSWKETERIFACYVTPKWGNLPISSIKRRQIVDLIEGMADATPYQANRTLAAVRKLFGWCLERDLIDASPVAGIKAPAKEQDRDRVLSDDEIKAIWLSSDSLGYPFGAFVRTLILTAQRLREVASMRWPDVDMDEGVWTLPREATKANRSHQVPLSPPVLELLESLPLIGTYVFTSRGDKPISGFSAAKRRLDKLSGVENWRFHDLRRSGATGIAKLGHSAMVPRVLNHANASVTAIYDRYEYLPEMRRALDAWSRHVESIVSGEAAKVVELRA